MSKYAVIGDPIAQSFSPLYFKEKFASLGMKGHSYEAIQVKDLIDLKGLLEQKDLAGFNVTIPHKQSIIPYLDKLSDAAAAIGAVNTVKIDASGQWQGYNTDYFGFRESLVRYLTKSHKHALIFGTGGSSRAIRFALRQLGVAYTFVSRNSEKGVTYDELTTDIILDNKLLINTTPVGMSPFEANTLELPYEGITKNHLCYDLVYNPQKTLFLNKAEGQGAIVINGLEMLHLQADKAWDIWKS